jgi:hypothetical protein
MGHELVILVLEKELTSLLMYEFFAADALRERLDSEYNK